MSGESLFQRVQPGSAQASESLAQERNQDVVFTLMSDDQLLDSPEPREPSSDDSATSGRFSRVLAGGLFALFFGAIMQALAGYGVITTTSGHLFMLFAWVIGVLIITTEIIPGRPTKHKLLWIIGLGVVLLCVDLIAARYASSHEQDKGTTSVAPTPTPTAIVEQAPSPTPQASARATPTPVREERILIEGKPDDLLRSLNRLGSTQARHTVESYLGKWVEISGRVYKMYPQITISSQPPYTGPIMSISTRRKNPQQDIGAYCERFNEKWKARAVLSEKGESVTLRGRITRISGRRFSIEDCEFVE